MDAVAIDAPGVDSDLVATYFEGQLIDDRHHTFGSQPAGSATSHSHIEAKQWKSVQQFMDSVYPTLRAQAQPDAHSAMLCDGGGPIADGAPCTATSRPHWPSLPRADPSLLLLPPPPPSRVTRLLHTGRHVFMRWKEQYFLCGADGRLSITGVYLLALDRLTGDISGIYWDEQSQPRRSGKKRCQQLVLQRVPDAKRDGRISTHALR